MRWKTGRTLGSPMIIFIAALALVGFILYTPNEEQLLPEKAVDNEVAPPPHQLDLLAFWHERASIAQQAGQPDVAANYQKRLDAYELGLPAASAGIYASGLNDVPVGTFDLYLQSPAAAPAKTGGAAAKTSSTHRTLAKHEPASGVYLGMLGADRRVGYDVTKVESVYGKKHAIYLAYVGWRKVQTDTNTYFPTRTAERIKALDGAIQIGWEPRYGLDDVKDDEYVRRFAREAKEAGLPVFLRYASEMNGSWVPWYDEPKKFIEKFRLIHDIMEQEAPNVAMVWSPNFWPPDTIDDYYPGDEYVDWVGFSLYNSPYTNGKEQLFGSVIDTFAPLYDRYSHKPIMIAEGAIAHTHLPTNTAYPTWGETQLAYMYGLLPRMFPQVKGITYFNFSRAQAQRTNAEFVYDIGENMYMDGIYRRMARSDLYLSKVEHGKDPMPNPYKKLAGASIPPGSQSVMIYPKLENPKGEAPFAIALYQGDRLLGVSYEAPWEMAVEIRPETASKPWYTVAYNMNMEPVSISSRP
ncbi:glycoside hydrolase family 26 protein [Paenibacillus koleovorans]|uniref:glycoside hydrolase family 26 protein n=1 Tax=Paenibacillus koleovorans TaxID=121608 RepID=UPI0013E34934|nr:glycosyl hydrolase [Paenibacillus koleovorans]